MITVISKCLFSLSLLYDHIYLYIQAVLSLNMAQWKEICEAFELDECIVDDREGYEKDKNLDKMLIRTDAEDKRE